MNFSYWFPHFNHCHWSPTQNLEGTDSVIPPLPFSSSTSLHFTSIHFFALFNGTVWIPALTVPSGLADSLRRSCTHLLHVSLLPGVRYDSCPREFYNHVNARQVNKHFKWVQGKNRRNAHTLHYPSAAGWKVWLWKPRCKARAANREGATQHRQDFLSHQWAEYWRQCVCAVLQLLESVWNRPPKCSVFRSPANRISLCWLTAEFSTATMVWRGKAE